MPNEDLPAPHRRRRQGIRLLVAATVVAGIGLISPGPVGAEPAPGTQAVRPNIVMIMTDDQTMPSLAEMPNVKALLTDQGTRFTSNFASYPLCCPSRATYLTGQLPHNHDVWDNAGADGGYDKLRGAETLPVWLGRTGYKTVHIGKYLNGYGKVGPTHIPPGWQEWHGLVTAYRMWGYSINNNGTVRTYGDVHTEDPALYQTDVLRNMATNYIGRNAGGTQPFFLSWAPLAPHGEIYKGVKTAAHNPRPAPRHKHAFDTRGIPKRPNFDYLDTTKPTWLQRGPLTDAEIGDIRLRHRSRLESLLAVDEAVKAIVDKLRAEGILSNTAIIFTSDNGFMQGHHRIPEGKIHPYDPSAHVPLVVRAPGVPAGQVTNAMVSNVDLAATILDLADTTPGITIDGLSLIPIAQNPASVAGRHLLLETGEKGARTPTDRWYKAIRTERYLYVEHWRTDQEGVDRRTGKELYDHTTELGRWQIGSLHNDPAYTTIRDQLAAELVQLQQCAGVSCHGV